jgi:endo-1,4-beta-xylanase
MRVKYFMKFGWFGLFSLLVVGGLAGLPFSTFVVPVDVKANETPVNVAQTTAPSLRSLATQRGIKIGAAVSVSPLRDNPNYRQTLAEQFNLVTPENAMKFQPLRPTRQGYNFEQADAIAKFARNNNMSLRGHTLVWHNQLPKWFTEREWTKEEAIAILREHIYQVVGRYRGQVMAWDVVNEAIADDGSLRDTIWRRTIGPDYIEMAFRWAHEADPGAKLFYNDYGGEGRGKKSDAIYGLVEKLLLKKVPIHGVGLQMHVGLNSVPPPQAVANNMLRLSELGLDVHITEMDVQIQNGTGTTAERLAAQAKIYREMLQVCLEAKNCKAFVTWGFTDAYSWIPGFTGHPDAGLIFDKNYQPKPAFSALIELLKQPVEVRP